MITVIACVILFILAVVLGLAEEDEKNREKNKEQGTKTITDSMYQKINTNAGHNFERDYEDYDDYDDYGDYGDYGDYENSEEKPVYHEQIKPGAETGNGHYEDSLFYNDDYLDEFGEDL